MVLIKSPPVFYGFYPNEIPPFFGRFHRIGPWLAISWHHAFRPVCVPFTGLFFTLPQDAETKSPFTLDVISLVAGIVSFLICLLTCVLPTIAAS